jgi:hypothetical protein
VISTTINAVRPTTPSEMKPSPASHLGRTREPVIPEGRSRRGHQTSVIRVAPAVHNPDAGNRPTNLR